MKKSILAIALTAALGTGAALADETQPIMLPEFVTQDTAASADEAGALVPALFLVFMVLGSS